MDADKFFRETPSLIWLAPALGLTAISAGLGSYSVSGDEPLNTAKVRKAMPSVKNVPMLPVAEYGNASYVPPDSVSSDLADEVGVDIPANKMRAAQQHGIAFYDPTTNNAVLAHELGHAQDFKQNNRSMFGYRLSLALAGMAGLGAGAAAHFGGRAMGASPSGSVGMGAAGGLVAGLLAGSYALSRESDATANADSYISKSKDPATGRRKLGLAYLTYLIATGLAPAVAGAATAHYLTRVFPDRNRNVGVPRG